MKIVFFVGAGGFLGAVLRYALCAALPDQRLGLGTLAVNLLGCLAVGAVAGWAEARGDLGPYARALLVSGFVGSFTTFSAFGIEVEALAREGRALTACAVVAAHVLGGLGAVVLGRLLLVR
ncbi:MAG: CrcB family protein [Planctomycetota bacterium]|nr:CrcB family protein [Planctomycetota bacterium]MDP6764093.1 CrcB family protein [Planctomycetota bacterium]MDP6990307.1 CrcB family protein [Planctomycetota bacterium]